MGNRIFESHEDNVSFYTTVPVTDKVTDEVSHPAHYTQGGVVCIDAIESAVSGLSGVEAFLTANIIKYIWRWKWKNGTQDLEKARWYLDRLIEKTSAEQEDK